ncbi:MAG TPA: ATP-binding cassette domain-containing protein, partial [Streptosporangiaceae bacterium]|nr:ATP-binding cassette domain-containing protein [Streptosporangiaceae bacterium]
MSTAELAGQTAEPAVAAVAVRDLQVVIESTGTPVISDVSFGIARGEILGVVGESGSGKTTVGLVAAYSRNALDDVLMRGMDVIMALPSILLALVAVAI